MTFKIPYAFGESGDLNSVPDTSTGTELSFQQGWSQAYELAQDQAGYRELDRAQHNFLWNVVTGNIKQWQEQTYPSWFADIEYPVGAKVRRNNKNYNKQTNNDGTGSEPGLSADWVVVDELQSQNDIVGGSIFKGEDGEHVQNGDEIPAGTTHLRISIGGSDLLVAAWSDLTLPATVTTVPTSDNGFNGYDIVTDQGTFEFVSIQTKEDRGNGKSTGWGVDLDDEVTNQQPQLQRYASESSLFEIPYNKKVFTNDEILIPHGNVDISGEITAIGATGSFALGAVVTIGEYAGQQQTTISVAANKGDATLNVTSTSGIEVGDIVTIYDSTDFSFAPQRFYYRAGEHLKVSEVVSSTQLRFTGQLYDNYAVGINLYKLNPKKCNIKSLNVTVEDEAAYAVTLESISEGVIPNTRLSGGRVATLQRNRCYDLEFETPSNVQSFDDGSTTNYAHYTLACQKVVDMNPNVRALRHALALTGRDQELSIPNRECGAIGGTATTFSSTPGVTAVDFHGCTENCFYDKMDIFGGTNVGGKNNRVHSRIYQGFQPTCIRGSEMVNANHDFSGSTLITSLAGAQSYGQVIDIGGLTDPINSGLESGGLLDFSYIEIDTSAGNPSAQSKFIEIANRGYVGDDLKISFIGARRVGDTSQSNWFRINIGQVISGSAFDKIDLRDADMDGIALRSLANETLCDGYKSVGSSVMTQLAVGLEVFVANGRAILGNVHVEDCNLSPVNVRGETAISGTRRAYLGNIKCIDGNKSAGSTTEENSGMALRDLDFAQYNDVLTLGLSVDVSAVNALRANNVTTLVVGSWHAEGYSNNDLSLAGGTAANNMQFGYTP